MKKIIIASKNPVKINATLIGFQNMFLQEQFEIEGVSVSSGVSDQPKNDLETYQGAWNRVNRAQDQKPGADFYVGIEGGVEEKHSGMESFAWVVVKDQDNEVGKGRTGTFFLPLQIAELIKQGKELGEADNIVFDRINAKQENGVVGILTDNIIDRTKYYTEAVVLALIPFKNKKFYCP
ncbi:TPA: inositol monophosphatase [Candidatus Uhrbacteria bacterium]|uniref:Probable inosine/xanthosine triphosphatase n=2 Tax=Candidatus Uhriibacteriota TaxID=1752732 RepID=A0A0G1SFI3_9BACT|nr:MAG: hypothetical protein UX45_C0006G0015 [Candidatus Uhrbacteria bacterium GW2011_GWF2_46_218]KKU40848.1 MAG: hypothetical protein UX57_C0009G0015 [Candidatus Uhrbacteria bacterium GW2011_GWE2_46_68]HBK33918.1 inositol monophosphatase [Candidatus Uhrbacteria bacterium]HCB19657.1 inositol monophosphatase [Candidatus Uhrbacteria bacterium]